MKYLYPLFGVHREWACSLPMFFLYASFAVLLTACGGSGRMFSLEGKFKNLNQGEFYVYSTDGALSKIDTIRLSNGRFSYELPCNAPGTIMLVFPNFTEQPVFVEPGKSAEVRGDATNLKEIQVKGTKANELMTVFRRQIIGVSPPEAAKLAEQFIADYPDSPVGVYLVKKYFVQAVDPDYRKAASLLNQMAERQPKNGQITLLKAKLDVLGSTTKGSSMPSFSGKTLSGQTITSSSVSGTPVVVVMAWAAWSYDSMNMLRQLRTIQRGSHGKMKLVSIFLDSNETEGRRVCKRDSLDSPLICGEQFYEHPVPKAFGLTFVGDNAVYRNGKLEAHSLMLTPLLEKVRGLVE
ncbi:MAG: DUF4369 domain-containing protein [Prevotella sp.]|nr:DUF4369 domain-containing protein [Prevotella sp.]